METYLDLCTEFYDIDKPDAPKEEFDFYLAYVENAKGPILEPMCGTGRFLLPLVKMGFNIEGYDASNPMLNVLKQKALENNLKIRVWNQYVENSKSGTQYDLIFIPSGSMGLITDDNKLQIIYRIFYDQLLNGGKLVFGIETTQTKPKNIGMWGGRIAQKSQDEYILLSSLAFKPENNICSTICRYERVKSNNLIKTEFEKINVKLHEAELLKNQLKEIGFSSVSLLKAHHHASTADINDEFIIVECVK